MNRICQFRSATRNQNPLLHLAACSIVLTAGVLLIASCGRIPSPVNESANSGDLEIRACVASSASLSKVTAAEQTTFDSLVVEISAPDFATIHQAKKLVSTQLVFTDTLIQVPAGADRSIRIFTVDKAGNIIHADSAGTRSVRIDPGVANQVSAVLIPAMGSIYLEIGAVPTKVDSVFATFTSSSASWSIHAKRSPRMYMSIDKIPHGTKGRLIVVGVDSTGTPLYSSTTDLTIDARNVASIPLSFVATPGGLSLEISIQTPGAAVAFGSMTGTQAAASERGDLIITEIMYAANDSEYIEVFNPREVDSTYDTLVLDLDGVSRAFTNVTVPAKGCYVFGRRLLPWVDIAPSSTSALDLSSTGNWITLRTRDGVVVDQVIFAGGTNDLEWPVVSGKRSIELNAGITDPIANNYGRNWHMSTTPIPGCESQFGTPKVR